MRFFPARIAEIHPLSSQVKAFTFDVGNAPFSFKAGQWIDLCVTLNGKKEVGGYSITSSPSRQGSFDLAVKQAEIHPVTRHLHEAARVGDAVEVSEGQGPFFYEPDAAKTPLVLLGGGIGITPLVSIFRAASEQPGQKVTLIYTATRIEDFVFRKELEKIARANPDARVVFSLTGKEELESWIHERGRISRELLARVGFEKNAIHFLCGPKGLIDELSEELLDLGVTKEKIRYEKWW